MRTEQIMESNIRHETPKQLTVAELIEKLQKHNPNALVMIEGCDCDGAAADVETMSYAHTTADKVLIRRLDQIQ